MLQFVFATAAVQPVTPTDLLTIHVRNRARYVAAGVTGLLVHHQGSFLHILEGPAQTVQGEYEAVAASRDHRRLLLSRRAEVAARAFDGWGVALPVDPTRTQLPGVVDYAELVELAAYHDPVGPWWAVAEFCRGRLRQAQVGAAWPGRGGDGAAARYPAVGRGW
ncbi:BLUF domain-containing protein [bacterium]|nr:BLUF domain-containing protein [bacterium]